MKLALLVVFDDCPLNFSQCSTGGLQLWSLATFGVFSACSCVRIQCKATLWKEDRARLSGKQHFEKAGCVRSTALTPSAAGWEQVQGALGGAQGTGRPLQNRVFNVELEHQPSGLTVRMGHHV